MAAGLGGMAGGYATIVNVDTNAWTFTTPAWDSVSRWVLDNFMQVGDIGTSVQ